MSVEKELKINAVSKDVASLKIFNLFLAYKTRRFIFVKPGGNFGDFLIYKGAEKLAKLAGIDYHSVAHQEFMNSRYPSDSVIYIHGSGGFNPWWSGTPIDEFERAVKTHRGTVIIGPQSVYLENKFLKEKVLSCFEEINSGKVYFFTREKCSFDALSCVLSSGVQLDCDHDTAFNLTASDLITERCKGRYVFLAIREDKEAVGATHRNIFDLQLDPIMYCENFSQWLLLHIHAKKIITNRLHSAILGTIFQIPTILLPNNYHKNRSVWEHSLKQRGVEWRATGQDPKSKTILDCNNVLVNTAIECFYQKILRHVYGVNRAGLLAVEKLRVVNN